MKMNETNVNAVTRPPNHITSPYAYGENECARTDDAGISEAYYKDNCQILEDRVHGYAEVLLFTVIDSV